MALLSPSLSTSETAASSSSSLDFKGKGKSIASGSQTIRRSHQPYGNDEVSLEETLYVPVTVASQDDRPSVSPRGESDVHTVSPPTDVDIQEETEQASGGFGDHVRRILGLRTESASISGSDIDTLSEISWGGESSDEEDEEEGSTPRQTSQGGSPRVRSDAPLEQRLDDQEALLRASAAQIGESGQRTRPRRRSAQETKPRRRRVVYRSRITKYQEKGFSRDFFLIVGLCIGIACFVILLGRMLRTRLGGLDVEGLMVLV